MQQKPLSTITERSDRILYLASLVSNAQAIDVYLRPLRQLMKLRAKDEALTPEEEAVLDRIENNIKQYLLASEHLRSFTAETLDQHLYERGEARKRIRRLRWLLCGALCSELVVSVGISLLTSGPTEIRLRLSINMAIAFGYVIGAYLFLTSHRKFSAEHQAAYKLFSYAFIAGSVITAINLILTLVYSGNVPWSRFWYVTVITYVTFMVMYFGARQLALLYGIKSIILKLWIIIPIALLGVVLLMMFPWAWMLGVRSGVNSIGGLFTFVFTASTGWLMGRVQALANPLYKAPITALELGFICISLAWAIIIVIPILPATIGSDMSIVSSVLFIICSLFLIRAGYALSKLSSS